jgi:predicted nucleic acid-binding protein
VIAADTSVVVAAFASWHVKHAAARAALDGEIELIEHCALETYSVLTRLPAPHRSAGAIVIAFLRERFQRTPLRLPAAAQRAFVLALPERGIQGGGVYDALVAATAAHYAATLVSCDRRAVATYERYEVRTQLF